MNIDAELETWREQWQSDTAVPADLRRRVERQTLWMKIALAGDVLVTVVIGGGVSWLAARSPEPAMFVLAAVTWLFIAAAWIFALRINYRNWEPAAMDTAAFVDLSIRRCRGRLTALRFGVVLFVTEIVFCLAWIYLNSPSLHKSLTSWLFFGSVAIDFVWFFTAAFFVFVAWYGRRKRAELKYFLGLARD